MLANGAKLGYKAEKGAASYTDLPGLKEIPDWGSDPEKVDNSALTDPYEQYEMGIGELGDVKYKFKYDNSKADTPYRILKALSDSKEVGFFEETLKDGTKTDFSAQVSVKRTGGGVNGVIELEVTMILQGAPTVTDPAA